MTAFRKGTLVAALAGAMALGTVASAFADDTALPADAVAFGASVKAEGAAPEPLRIAVLSYQGTAFWEAADVGIAAAQAYLKPLGTTVDYIQLGTSLTPEIMVAGLDGALAKQYQRLFEMDGVELTFDEDALLEVAKKAIERKTGARGLRAILEDVMLDIMYDIPSREDISTCRITKAHAYDHRPLAPIAPTIIPPGHYYVQGTSPDSFDSRYRDSGLVRAEQVIGVVVPLF